MKKVLMGMMVFIGCAVSAAERRPMAIHFMLDGLRADAVESGQMPNVVKLKKGTWQPGYAAAWTLFARTVPESTVSAPNHVSIATGVTVAKHGVKDNGQTANGQYASYPTWLARVVVADANRHALFAYSWSEDGSLGGSVPGVTLLSGTDAENAVAVPARLAASDAPDATMLFIDCPDAGGHSGGYYPYSAAYLDNVKAADNTIGACLAAIAARPTFAEEDWLVVVTSDHGGFSTSHSTTHAAQAVTVPIVIAGRSVMPGEITGVVYNYDPTANLLAHFGLQPTSIDARAVAGTAAAARPLADALAVYLPFNDFSNCAPNATVTAVANGASASIENNGFAGKGLKIASGGTVKLEGSDALSFEDGGKSFTVIVWVRQNQSSFSSDPVIWSNKNWGSGGNPGLALVANGAPAGAGAKGVFFNCLTGTTRRDLGNFINEGATLWSFYAVTRTDDGLVKVYQGRRDGALCWVAEEAVGMTTSQTGYPFYLATDGRGTYGVKYVGELDDFALWTRGLSHDEVKRIYENGRRGLEFGELLAKEQIDQPTLAVTSYDGTTATLAFGGTRTMPYTLCVASGATDAGDDKYAWDNFATVAEIPAATQQYVYTLPAEFKSERRKFRFFLLKTAGLPYTKELQYLQSAGSSAVDTQVYPRSGTSVELDVAATTEGGCAWFFGSFCDTAGKRGNFGMAFRIATHYLHHEISGDNVNCFNAPYELNRDYHVNFSVTGVTVDDITAATGQTADGFFENGYSIELFRNRKNLAAYDATLKGRIGEVTLRADGATVRDLVPVADAEGNGAYFDRVNGVLHPEVAGTAFELGAERDATRLGWVRSVSGTLDGDAARLATAWWTGRGAAGDFTDPANWACTNAIGVAVEGGTPLAETTVYVGGATTFAVPEGATLFPHAGGIVFENACLAADCDWRGLAMGEIAVGSTIDLNGHALQFVGTATGTPNAFTVTDTSLGTPGELHVLVAEGVTFTNSRIVLAGKARLVKDGSGTLQANATGQTYAGGTEVVAGRIVCGSQIDTGLLFGVAGSEITVRTGASFDFCNQKGGEAYPFALDGGTVMNSTGNDARIGSLRLLSDSTLSLPNGNNAHDLYVAKNSVWDLNGYTLSIMLEPKDPDLRFDGAPMTVRNGTIKTPVNGGWLHETVGIITEGDVTYDFSHAIRQKASASVRNFICRASNNVESYTTSGVATALTVTGRFTPMTDYFCNVVLVNGSTLDLRSRTSAFRVKCSMSGKTYTTSFPADGTVTVDLAGRTDLEQGLKVLDFAETSVPGTAVFAPDTATAENYMFERRSDGIYLAAFVKTALWTGEAEDGSTANPANWDCRDANDHVVENALPGLSTAVTVRGDTFMNIAGDVGFYCASMTLDNVTLSADSDWSGFASPATGEVDLKGYRLTLSHFDSQISIKDTGRTDDGGVRVYGELHAAIASGTVENAAVAIRGGLTFVKDGAGTFVAKVANQYYTGGTVVSGGTFICGVSPSNATPLGPQDSSAITVYAEGTLDLNGITGMEKYALVLAGGTLQNSGADNATIGSFTMTDDSKINFPDVGGGKNDIKVVANTVWNLGGKLLTITFGGSDPDLFFQNTPVTIRNGTVKTTGSGFFNDQTGIDASDNVTYDFRGVNIRQQADAKVFNFINSITTKSVASRKTDHKTPIWLTLSGTFTPLSPYCCNMLLLSGATIDLSTYDAAWSLESDVSYWNYSETTRTDFADGAMIKIDLGEREFKEKTKIITWNKPPTNLSTLHFRSADRQYPLVADPEGVWVLPKLFMIILR